VAKQNQSAAVLESPPTEVGTLAAQLYVAAWRPEDFKTEELARKCFDAAEAFERVRKDR
jgi:hypothetical protein